MYAEFLGDRVYRFVSSVSAMVFRARLLADPAAKMATWHPGWIEEALREGYLTHDEAADIRWKRQLAEYNPQRSGMIRDVRWEQ